MTNLDNCSFGCSKCDNYNGCLSCNQGKILHNNNCLNYCPPELKDVYPQCTNAKTCTPKITIIEKKSYQIMDGSNFEISANTTTCSGTYYIEWETDLPEGSYITLNEDQALIINRNNMIIPDTYSFKVLLYTDDKLVDSDNLDIEFISVK
jgi:hypothetical protein